MVVGQVLCTGAVSGAKGFVPLTTSTIGRNVTRVTRLQRLHESDVRNVNEIASRDDKGCRTTDSPL